MLHDHYFWLSFKFLGIFFQSNSLWKNLFLLQSFGINVLVMVPLASKLTVSSQCVEERDLAIILCRRVFPCVLYIFWVPTLPIFSHLLLSANFKGCIDTDIMRVLLDPRLYLWARESEQRLLLTLIPNALV